MCIRDSNFGEPEVLVPRESDRNNYYPAYSPDGDYIVFNRAEPRTWVIPNGSTLENNTSSYAHPAAELWLMTRDGEHLTRLDAANGSGDLQNSYPKPLTTCSIRWVHPPIWFIATSRPTTSSLPSRAT